VQVGIPLNRQGEAHAGATILLIDRPNTPMNDQLYANQKVGQFLQTHGARERIGIDTLGSTLRVVQDLTDDPYGLNRAVRSIKPQAARRLSAHVTVESTGDAVTDGRISDSLTRLQNFVVEDRVRTS
jgi:hypothetical protein